MTWSRSTYSRKDAAAQQPTAPIATTAAFSEPGATRVVARSAPRPVQAGVGAKKRIRSEDRWPGWRPSILCPQPNIERLLERFHKPVQATAQFLLVLPEKNRHVGQVEGQFGSFFCRQYHGLPTALCVPNLEEHIGTRLRQVGDDERALRDARLDPWVDAIERHGLVDTVC